MASLDKLIERLEQLQRLAAHLSYDLTDSHHMLHRCDACGERLTRSKSGVCVLCRYKRSKKGQPCEPFAP